MNKGNLIAVHKKLSNQIGSVKRQIYQRERERERDYLVWKIGIETESTVVLYCRLQK